MKVKECNKPVVEKKSFLAGCLLVFCSATAYSAPEFSASLELDIDAVDTAETDVNYDENGFVEVNAYSKKENGHYFVAAKGGVRLQTDGDNDVVIRDSYIQFGSEVWDLQIGRFEAINLFPLGKDTIVEHVEDASVYEANLVRGFVGNNGGQIVLHVNASENFSFELDTLYGDDDVSGDDETAFAGIRPSVTYSTDNFSLTAGMESVKYDLIAGGEIDKQGFALTSTFSLGTASINLAAAHLDDDSAGAEADEVNSFTANMTMGNFGAGLVLSEEDNGANDDPDVTTFYVAYTVPLLNVDDATVTFAGSHSTADNVDDDEVTALRVRFNYTL